MQWLNILYMLPMFDSYLFFSVRSMLLLRTQRRRWRIFHCMGLFIEQPLWASIGWSIVFGPGQFLENLDDDFGTKTADSHPEEQKLWRQGFAELEAREFRKLIDIGTWGSRSTTKPLVESGHLPKSIWMLAWAVSRFNAAMFYAI